MIVYDNNKKKPAVKTEDERKEEMLEELKKESLSTICLACVYAKKFEETGMDITEKWATAEQQSEIIQNFYYQGYENGFRDGIEKGKEIEREEAALIRTGEYGLNDDYFDAGIEITTDDLKKIDLSKIVKTHSKHRSPTKKKRRR